MLAATLPVRSLLIAIFALTTGSGLLSTLVSLRLERFGSSTMAIGLVGTAYFVGLTLGAMRLGPIVARVGHIRAFAAFVSIFSASALGFGLFADPAYWSLLRFINGLCVAGVYLCLESWLNERAEPQNRGAVLAGYMIFLYLGQAAGQFLLGLRGEPALPFLAVAIFISLAAVPVLLTHIPQPEMGSAPVFRLRRLYDISPLGSVGAIANGVMLGAFYGLAPVHAGRIGLDLAQTAQFMSAAILGGVLLQWPLGRLSDRFDRRRVIVAVFAGALVCAFAIALAGANGIMLYALVALFGGLSFALYPLCVAHTNDHLEPGDRVGASGGLVLLYSLGAACGPMAGAAAMAAPVPGGLFLFIGLCAGAAFGFGLWRQLAAPPVPADMQQSYQILPRTSPAAAILDQHAPAE